VRINNGAVLNDGPSLATVSGKVANNGAVTVVVSGGGKTAQGAGCLSGKLGKGSWRGGDWRLPSREAQ
jgi:hypothetical protein